MGFNSGFKGLMVACLGYPKFYVGTGFYHEYDYSLSNWYSAYYFTICSW